MTEVKVVQLGELTNSTREVFERVITQIAQGELGKVKEGWGKESEGVVGEGDCLDGVREDLGLYGGKSTSVGIDVGHTINLHPLH